MFENFMLPLNGKVTSISQFTVNEEQIKDFGFVKAIKGKIINIEVAIITIESIVRDKPFVSCGIRSVQKKSQEEFPLKQFYTPSIGCIQVIPDCLGIVLLFGDSSQEVLTKLFVIRNVDDASSEPFDLERDQIVTPDTVILRIRI